MITKRTRALSIIAVALMLVSMFACFVIPASADANTMAATYELYSAMAEDATEGDEALIAALAEMKAAIDAGDASNEEALTTAVTAAAVNLTFSENAKPRVAWTAEYAAAGYTGTNWSISKAEDWRLMISGEGAANAGSGNPMHSYYVTQDIDFENVAMNPIACFRGHMYGQNHTFKNVNITVNYTASGANDGINKGVALVSRSGAGAVATQVWRDLGLTGTMTMTADNSGDKSNTIYAGTHGASTGNTIFTNCWSNVTLTVTAKGGAKPIYIGGIAGAASGTMTDCRFSGTMNITLTGSVTPNVGGILATGGNSLVGCTFDGLIDYNSSIAADDYFGGILGSASSATLSLDHCAFTGTIIDRSSASSATNKGTTAGLVGYIGSNNNTINNCISDGTIISANSAATSIAYIHNVGKVYNTIGGGFVLSGGDINAGSALKSHSSLGSADAASVAAVNMPLAFYKGDSTTAAATLSAASAAEAAYKINNGYNTTGGTQTYYTIKDGKVAFGTEADQVRQITVIRGEQTFYAYAATGTVALADVIPGYAYAEAVTVKDNNLGANVAINDGKINMTGDVTVTVTDTAKSAKAALAAAEEAGWASKDLNMYTETAAWITAADELAKGDDVAAMLAKAAEMKGLVAGTATLTLIETASAPYSKKAAYANLGVTATTYSINSAEDWVQLTKDYTNKNCNLTLYVNRDIDFSGVENMIPLSHNTSGSRCYFNGKLYGQGHTFKDITIKQEAVCTEGYNGIALLSGGVGATVDGLGLTGTIENTSTTHVTTGVFIAGKSINTTVTNCWADVDVTVAKSAYNGQFVGFAGTSGGGGGSPVKVDNCFMSGSVTVKDGTATLVPYAYNPYLDNFINTAALNGTTQGNALIVSHTNLFAGGYVGGEKTFYNVGSPAVYLNAITETDATGLGFASAAAMAEHYNTNFVKDSAAEAAWVANANWASDNIATRTYWFSVDADGELCFSDEANQVRRIAISRGGSSTYAYAVAGDEVDLYAINPALASAESITSEDVAVADGKFTMVGKDVTITVNDSLESAKAALIEKIDAAWDAEDLNMYKETQAWLEAAEALVASGNDASAIVAKVIEIDTILAGELTLDTTAYAPLSKKAYYEGLGYPTDSKNYSIVTAADWIALTKNTTMDRTNGYVFHVLRDIDFNHQPMNPVAYGSAFRAEIQGNNHVFKNIKIEMAGGTSQYHGVALIAASGAGTGGQIYNLGLTGTITNTLESTDSRTGIFVGGRCDGNTIIENCWADVDVTAAMTTAGSSMLGFVGQGGTGLTIKNCYNLGTIKSLNGAAAFVGYAANATKLINTINAGEIISSGSNTSAMVNCHANIFATPNADGSASQYITNSYSVDHQMVFVSNGSYANLAAYNAQFTTETVKEAAYKTTAGANGAVYYTVKDGELAFGTATDRVFKVELTGDYKAVGYYLPGEVVDLYALGLPQYADTTFSGADVVDGKVTMGTADITITVAYGDSQKAGALEDLNELIALYEQYDQDLLDASSTVAAWLAAANAAKEADSYAAIRAQVIAAEAIVIKLADGVKPAFADFDLYAEYNTANNWTVATAADWLKAVSLGTDAKVLSANIYIIDDVDFGAGSAPFAPLGYGGTFKGNIYGGGHTLKNVNIQASAVTGTAPIALISQMGGNGTITEIGITGTVNGDGTADEHSFTAGLVGVVSGGAIKMIKVWNGATVTGDKATYAYAAGILGNSSNTDGLIINGAYNVGTVTSKGSHGTAENYAGAIIASGTSHYADALVTMFNAGTINKNGSTAGAAVLFRVNKGVTKVVRNTASTNVTVASYGDLAGIFEDTTVVANGYETGEIGYILNSYYTSDAGANFVDETGTALEKVYFSFDAEGKIVFGTEATQIRKITYSGVAEGTIYVNQGAKVPFADIAGAAADYKVNGELVDINSYVMPANDVVMTVEAQYDVEEYNAAKAGLDALLAEYKGYNLDLFENGDAMQTLINDVEWLYEDEDINGIIDKWADVSETPIELALKEGKYVPYSKKAAYAKVDDGTKYGIYDENDWAAMVAAGNNSGKTVYLMNSITLTAAETALINQWSGTFEGQGFTVSGIAITKTSGGKAGLFLTNAGTIKNLTLDGTMNVTFGSAEAYVDNPYVGMFGAAGGTVIGCTNSVDITVTAYAAAKNNCCIGTINGYLGSVTNSINEGTLNVTLYSAGSATRPMIGGIVGRTRSVTSGNTNNGAITVNLFGADGSVFIGGIGSDSVGADFSNSVNNGSITVNGGQRIYLGGISSDTDSVGSLANTRNNGDLTVTCRTGDNVRIVRVGGISSNALPANDAETPYTNTGDITVDAAGSNQVYVFGIAPTNTEGVVATNSGAIYVGGMKEADSTHSAGNTTSSADQTNVTICVHEDRVYTHNTDTKTHTMTCADCSHYEVLDCSGDWTYGAKEDFQIDGTTVNSTHSMTCDLCEEVYDEACVGTLVTNPADCTHGTIAKFNHGCGREDVIMVAGCEDHVFTGEFTTEGAAAGYEHRKCDCADCEVYESRLVDITFSTDCAGFVPGGDATVTLTMATGKLNAGTFTVSVGEGFTVKSVNGVEGNTLTLAEAMSAGDSFDIVVTAGATTYANGEVTIAISEAKNAADEDVIFENIVATVAINVTPGDANGDTKVDLIDAIIALREVAGVNDPGVCNVANAEMDGVPGISADDAVLIVRKWLKNV